MTMFSKIMVLGLMNLAFIQVRSQVITSTTRLKPELYSDKYSVTVTQNGHLYKSFTYISKASKFGQDGRSFNYSMFSFAQPVTIQVTKLNSTAATATLRPDRLGLGKVDATVRGNGSTVTFTLTKPAKVSVEFDDDPKLVDAMLVFADSLEDPKNVANPANSTVLTATDNNLGSIPDGKEIVYFAPGLHTIGYWQIPPSIKQVYFAPGSFVRGYLFANRKQSGGPLMINGRGILTADIYPFHYPDTDSTNTHSEKWYKGIEIEGGSNHIIEGVTLTTGSAFNIFFSANNCLIDNVKINGFRLNNDGIAMGGNNNTVNNCFLHVDDDALNIFGNDITIKNCTIWQLAGGSVVQLGWSPNTIRGNNLIDNMDVIHAEWTNLLSQNAGFINAMTQFAGSKNASVENFTVQNIYFDTNIIRFLDIRMNKNGKGQPANFKNFTFNNIHIKTNNDDKYPIMLLTGWDDQHKIDGFVFKNIYINGEKSEEQSPKWNKMMKNDNFSTIKLKKDSDTD